jgi:hypothetical protein
VSEVKPRISIFQQPITTFPIQVEGHILTPEEMKNVKFSLGELPEGVNRNMLIVNQDGLHAKSLMCWLFYDKEEVDVPVTVEYEAWNQIITASLNVQLKVLPNFLHKVLLIAFMTILGLAVFQVVFSIFFKHIRTDFISNDTKFLLIRKNGGKAFYLHEKGHIWYLINYWKRKKTYCFKYTISKGLLPEFDLVLRKENELFCIENPDKLIGKNININEKPVGRDNMRFGNDKRVMTVTVKPNDIRIMKIEQK